MCLNILREDWKPVLTINSIVYGLQYLFLVFNIIYNDTFYNEIKNLYYILLILYVLSIIFLNIFKQKNIYKNIIYLGTKSRRSIE